jgi:hypothetical protein
MTPVSIQRDITLNMIVPCTATHNFAPLPPVPPVPPPLPAAPLSLAACAAEIPVNMMWPPGMAMGSNKFTTTVFHQGMGIALDGHDCGIMIVHVQMAPAPNNMLTPLHIAFSSRKSMFSASTVQMNGKNTACCVMFALPPSPMVYCAEPMSPPLADAVTSYLNTLYVGMTLADFLVGAVSIAAAMVLDWVFRAKGPVDPKKSFGDLGFGKQLIGKVFGGGGVAEVLIRNGVAAAVGGIRALATDGPTSIQIGVGSPYLQIQLSADRDADGKWSASETSQVGNVQGQIGTQGAQVTVNNPTGSETTARQWGQSSPTTTTTDVSPMEGYQTTTTTTDPNTNTVTTVDSGGRGGGGGSSSTSSTGGSSGSGGGSSGSGGGGSGSGGSSGSGAGGAGGGGGIEPPSGSGGLGAPL